MTNKKLQRNSNQDLIDYESNFEKINWETLPAYKNKQIILSRLSNIQNCIEDNPTPFFLEEEL